jgi:hypothetical protein
LTLVWSVLPVENIAIIVDKDILKRPLLASYNLKIVVDDTSSTILESRKGVSKRRELVILKI